MNADFARSIAALAAEPELALLLKVTFTLALGLAAVSLLSRARASVRHLLAAATFAAVLAIPLVETAGPAVTVEVPVVPPAVAPAGSPAAETPSVVASRPASPVRRAAVWWSIGETLRGVWLLGGLFAFSLLAFDLWKLYRIRRKSTPTLELDGPTRELAAQIGITREVDVLLHEGVGGPLTCGLLRPAIILPADAPGWKRDDLTRALRHELEHIRRVDWPVQLVARVVCSVYWFHPLAWAAWRALCLNAERACDDAVLQSTEPADYADQLVSLARRQAGAPAGAVLGMASRRDLSVRVTALLDGAQRRGRVDLRAAVCVVALAVVAIAAIGPVRAIAQELEGDEDRRRSPLAEALYEASAGGRIDEIETLLSRGADVNSVVRGDGTPLLGAARRGHIDAVQFLLDRGADPNVTVGGDGSPLIGAAANGYGEVIALLLDRGADPNLSVQFDGSPLIVAAAEGYNGVVRQLLDRGADPNLGVEFDGNPLIVAARNGHLETVEILLDRGARIAEVVPHDENAMISASAAGRLAVVKYLVSRGADVNSRAWAPGSNDRPGEWRTPLSMARRHKHEAVVEYLLSAGAAEE